MDRREQEREMQKATPTRTPMRSSMRNTSVASSRGYWSWGSRSGARSTRSSDFSTASFTTVSSTGSPGSRWNPVRAVGICFGGNRSSVAEDTGEESGTSYSAGNGGGMSPAASTKGRNLRSYNSTLAEPGGMKFTISDVCKATRNFSPSCKIGQGGFGIVYKGRLGDGSLVAIKRAKKQAVYDNPLSVEFQSEVKTLARVEHLNLVRFLGYLEQDEERIIVVEYVPNGTLRDHLDGLNGEFLDIAARLDIAIDVAHAITYLHMYADHPIIHRDIKSSNILLTETLRAKVADFGFARLGATDDGVTHVSTQVKGTAGYLDPEYLRTYQLTEKSDVYSFGVLLIELVTGRRPIESKREAKERITTRWAMKKFAEGETIMTLDPRLRRDPATSMAMEKIFELALQCLAPSRHSRPSMRRCGEVLWSIRKEYREFSTNPNPNPVLAEPTTTNTEEDLSLEIPEDPKKQAQEDKDKAWKPEIVR
ncbi:calmodulin-binding receptor-like cytoplasmic kinase 2 isoform X1 [Nymphaea colorata]|nr:calmodulin-binding receptor-like cytoplasmic kinase 2 isoform X1 [Nymphaea colorata]